MTRDYANQFYMKDFYLSIKEILLHQAMQFAIGHVLITTKDVEAIFHTQKSVLYNDVKPCVKKEGGSFHVIVGVNDGRKCVNLLAFICYVFE